VKKVAPYVVFGVAYLALVLMACVATDEMSNQTASQVLGLLAPIVVAPIAIVAAKRAGNLSTFSVFVVAILSALGIYMVTTGICSALAVRVGSSISLLSLARLGGRSLALSNLIYVMAPVLWLQLLKHRDSHSAQANTAT
jgi:hypothetical protein